MGTRFYIHVGDTTSTGGRVLTGLDSHRWYEYACAYEGDLVACNACKSTGYIRCAGDRIPTTGVHGKEQALGGDLCVCKCTRPPRLVASQTIYGVTGSVDLREFDVPAHVNESFHTGEAPTREADTYDQRFLLIDEATGAPLAGRLYKIRHVRGSLQGRSDSRGFTERITGLAGDSVEIDVFAEGA